MASYIEWDTSPDEVMGIVEDDTKKHLYETSYKLWDAVIKLSPVRTGQYRASWVMSTGAPQFNSVERGGSPDSPLPPPKRPTLRSSEKLPLVFLTNAKPYAERIEYGWSSQAPYGVLINAIAII